MKRLALYAWLIFILPECAPTPIQESNPSPAQNGFPAYLRSHPGENYITVKKGMPIGEFNSSMKKYGAVRLTEELALKGNGADIGEEYWEIKSPHMVVRGQYEKGIVTRLSFWQDEEFDQPKERRPYLEKVTQSMMMRTTSVPIINLGEPATPLECSVGFKDKHEGIAENTKMGAALKTQKGLIYIDGLDSWADDLTGKEIIVEGTLEKRFDLPVYIEKQGEPPKSGIPVPEGTDLSEASTRYLLTNPIWTLKKE